MFTKYSIFNLLLFLLANYLCIVQTYSQSLIDYVNPQIDTNKSRWFYFSSACRPFGMVSLSPDNKVKGSWNSGYLYDSTEVKCFSHIHSWQMSGIPVMPTVGEILGHKGMEAYKSKFSHKTEIVKPGYHKLTLERYGITVELTSTCRVGMHKYSFPREETNNNVLFDVGAFLGHGPMNTAAIRKYSDRELRGYSIMEPTSRRPKPLTVYFVAKFDHTFSEFGGWEMVGGDKCLVRKDSLKGKNVGGYVRFKNLGSKPLLMKVAISYVSEEQAAINMKMELDHWDFNRVKKESFDEWNEELGKITVEGGSEEEKIKFYTDLWHALLGRHVFSDANGKFVDNTGDKPLVRQVPCSSDGKPIRNTYSSDAFWGAEFNLNILWSMAYPKIMSEFVSSLVDYYSTGGLIARGPSGGNYTYVMVGDQAIPLIAAAYNKGIRDFDVETAFIGSLKNSEPGGIRDYAGYETTANHYMEHYVAKGYVPEEVFGKAMHREGCAMTLFFAYEDWCMGQFAKALGKEDIYRKYNNRSYNYRYLYDKNSGWMRPRMADGAWLKKFSPTGIGFNTPGFVEGNSAVYTYYVPHNIKDLIYLMGGNGLFVKRLNKQFEMAAPENFINVRGHAANWIGYENQPSMHLAHLFNHAGAPWLAQYWVRRIKKDVYGDITPYGGYHGDEDQGQKGALGVLMAIGLFDVQGGASVDPQYEITSPLFDKITIQLDNRYYSGKQFVIKVKNNSSENCYIQSAKLNGKELNTYHFSHKEFAAGGLLEIELGATPNKDWGGE